jgi:hypothetical protein
MAACVLLACAGSLVAAPAPTARAPDLDLKALPHPLVDFRADPYIKAASSLQRMGKDKACKRLAELAREEQRGSRHGKRVIVLCRMLFTVKPGGPFRRPELGAAAFWGGTDYEDWPREPIEVVDGVPFVIVSSYHGAGQPESPIDYLEYCLSGCEWGDTKYTPQTADEKRKALEKLISSRKWKRPLREDEKDFFAQQIK